MDVFSVYSTPYYHPHHQTIRLTPKRRHHHRHHSHRPSPSTTSLSFSLKPPPPSQPPQPSQPRRPSPLTSFSSPKPSPKDENPPSNSNPLKSLINPTRISSTPLPPNTNTANAHTLSSKLRLSSKLNPPPPPPPLPTSPPTHVDKQTQETRLSEMENPAIEYRQEGKIFVGNLPNWIRKPEVTEFFRQFGPIKSVILIKGHNEMERNAGFGFVMYDGPGAEKAAMKAVEFDGVEFHGRVLTVKLDDGKRMKAKVEERARWVEGEDEEEWRSKWHEERNGARNAFKRVLDTQPENWQAVVTAFERIKKVEIVSLLFSIYFFVEIMVLLVYSCERAIKTVLFMAFLGVSLQLCLPFVVTYSPFSRCVI